MRWLLTVRPLCRYGPARAFVVSAGPVSFMEVLSITAAVAAPPIRPHLAFLALLPAIQAHARAAFRSLRSVHDREDAEAEVVARTWELFLATPVPPAAADRLAVTVVVAVRTKSALSHR